ncbi:MAG: DNA-directed RNA polymerase subunit beta [Candidatus Latescibacterota bacterium]|jgi:DNA-directed RNA polymerase subunit beta|nr:MAG: DNA-directed RNA polymerase subunit beta [Candidatus Latescibacterota bacterium]
MITVPERFSFAKIPQVVELPHLLEVQLESYERFLQRNVPLDRRENVGLESVFRSVFPVVSARGEFALEYVGYAIGEPKYTVEECKERDLTFAAPLKASLRLVVRETQEGEQVIKDIIQSEVYLGEIPLITAMGTFIINGAERVIVSQLHRSPGVVFDDDYHPNGKRLFNSRIIPYRGSWVEFTIDVNDIMYVYIDRRRKIPVTVLLKAMGFEPNSAIIKLFHRTEVIEIGSRASKKDASIVGRFVAEDVVSRETGEIILEAGSAVTETALERMKSQKVAKIAVVEKEGNLEEDVILKTIEKDPTHTQEEALKRLYNLMRPGDPPNAETAKALLDRLFFNPKRYNLEKVGRHKMNRRLGVDVPIDTTTLTEKDFVAVVANLIHLKETDGPVDDIDHLGNRRVRSVGELLANQFSVGLARMARIIRERMTIQEAESPTPYDLVNARTISAVVQSFFGSSQLSQFMDQTNPLAELTHKRRLSALGPGGLTRERAGFEVRDVHYTHYGRMCPIETPEGPNIGLITSLATFARVNEFGFLETPYRKVKNGAVTDETVMLSADQEDTVIIAHANAKIDKHGKFVEPVVMARFRGDFVLVDPKEVHYMDVSPNQLVSAAAALIPFLEHDDANRALMGCNMQRQAVPLIKAEEPLVGTGLEGKVAYDSGVLCVARRAGRVEAVEADRILLSYGGKKEDEDLEDFSGFGGVDEYRLIKFQRSNQDTCVNQKPIVEIGQKVRKGEVIADSSATRNGELALGRNVIVAFMPWRGYNFEDAIIISERLVTDDTFTSVHIEEFETQVRDTKAGMEEITREIPNVSEEMLANLDGDGIVRVGAHVKAGDILVGKVTPKGETELTPEERLLKAIFGEKAGDVRDASLKAPPGMDGIVVDIKLFSRKERDERSRSHERRKLQEFENQKNVEIQHIKEKRRERLERLMIGQISEKLVHAETGEVLARAGRKITDKMLKGLDIDHLHWGLPVVKDAKVDRRIQSLMEAAARAIEKVESRFEKESERITRGDELPPGVSKLVKVYVARKRKVSVGDKMAGRHGNKGVVSRIVPIEDMPHLPDGTPIDVILNPLGVPSRMNLGQILETHLGWAVDKLGYKVATPVFNGATIDEIKKLLVEAGLPESGKVRLMDGMTGEPFDEDVTVGNIYIMKLSHLVDDKIHARSIGPYSLVSQQPLGGKAQFGGQRFGEMEVWALEAYGAAYTLQELLTVKSDDVAGRSKIYETIVKGENAPDPGLPESFNVLIKELQSLCLDVQLEKLEKN